MFNKYFKTTIFKKNTLTIIFALFTVKFINYLKDMLIANYFGLSEQVDIYLYALLVPLLVYAVVSNSFNQYFIPHYLKVKSERPDTVNSYLTLIFLIFGILILFVSYITCWIIPKILVSTNTEIFVFQALADSFFTLSHCIGIYFFFFTFGSALTSLMQAEHYYKASIFPQFIINISSIMFFILWHKKFLMLSAIFGLAFGSTISFVYLLWFCIRKRIFYPRFNFQHRKFLKAEINLRHFIYLLISFIFPTLIAFVDKQTATFLGSGMLSALTYGNSIPTSLSSIIGYSLGIAVFSYFSQWIVKNEKDKIINTTRRSFIYLTLLVIPLCIFIIVYATEIIGVLFQRGEFTSTDTRLVSQILQYYVFTIYLFSTTSITIRIISSLFKNKFFLILFPGILLIKILFNFILVPKLGILGLPIATVLMYIIYINWTIYHLHTNNLSIINKNFLYIFSKCLIFIVIFSGLLFTSKSFISNSNYLSSLLIGSLITCIIYTTLFFIFNKTNIIKLNQIKY